MNEKTVVAGTPPKKQGRRSFKKRPPKTYKITDINLLDRIYENGLLSKICLRETDPDGTVGFRFLRCPEIESVMDQYILDKFAESAESFMVSLSPEQIEFYKKPTCDTSISAEQAQEYLDEAMKRYGRKSIEELGSILDEQVTN